MNKVTLIGRLTKEPEIRTAQSGTTVVRYSLAVQRAFKSTNGQQETDFINCICFKKTAEFAEKYLHKGMRIAVNGRIQTGSYTNKDGQKVYTTDVVVEEHEFVESRQAQSTPPPVPSSDGFMDIPDEIGEDLPFN
jgi:single-strand DNA-binding protein